MTTDNTVVAVLGLPDGSQWAAGTFPDHTTAINSIVSILTNSTIDQALIRVTDNPDTAGLDGPETRAYAKVTFDNPETRSAHIIDLDPADTWDTEYTKLLQVPQGPPAPNTAGKDSPGSNLDTATPDSGRTPEPVRVKSTRNTRTVERSQRRGRAITDR